MVVMLYTWKKIINSPNSNSSRKEFALSRTHKEVRVRRVCVGGGGGVTAESSRVASIENLPIQFNPWYTGRLFHWYMLGESIRHFRGVGSILSLLFYF